MTNNNYPVPIWKKYALTVQEAAEYFGVGEKRIRIITHNNRNANYLLWNGSKVLIKRVRFEEYLDSITYL